MTLRTSRKAKRYFNLALASVPVALWPAASYAQMLTGYDEAPIPQAPLTSDQPESQSESHPVLQASKLESQSLISSDEPVSLDAEKMTHDENTGIITASGNVFLVQAGRILRADEISYNLKTDTAVAKGHVVLNEESGDIHYAEKVKFNDKLKNGFVEGVKVYLADGSRFTARDGRRVEGMKTIMADATYTPCELCKKHPERPPLWQMRASEVTHDEEAKSVSYKNARFEAKGVPIAYFPYFSHPDGTVKRKSGLLSPSGGYTSDLGAIVKSQYYWNIAPDRDATIGLAAMTNEYPLLTGEYRRRWNEADLEIGGGVTYSKRTDKVNGVSVEQDEEVRGHVLGQGRWDMNEKWRSGVNVAWASDDQYMRQYDFSDEDVLENEIYAERFSGRNYAVGRVLTFQDMRVRDLQEDQPEVVPEIYAGFTGDPDSVPALGGRWSAETSFLGLQREGSSQDVNRLSLKAAWQRRMVSDYGLLTTVDASVREDIYNTRDNIAATLGSGIDDTVTATRFFPQMNVQGSYPLVKPMEKMQAVIEPVASITLAPNIDVDDNIPNEDSQDVQIDAGNIFEPDRFSGLDRVEDQSRVTYGVRAGLYGYGGSHGDVFLGQSHRFQDDDNPFPAGSGLDRQNSDIVGQVSVMALDKYDLSYRFQLGSAALSSERHEIDARADWNRFILSSRYLFASSLEGTTIDESREQLQASVMYYFSKKWRGRMGATQDLGESPGLRRGMAGLDYFGQCLSWSLIAKRNFTEDATGESATEITFNIGLKNLGEFKTSGLREPDDRD